MKNRIIIERKIIALVKYAERNRKLFYEHVDSVNHFKHRKRLNKSINKISIQFMNDYFHAIDTSMPHFMYPSLSEMGYLKSITEVEIIQLLYDYIENYQMTNLIEFMSKRQLAIYYENKDNWYMIRKQFCHFPEIRDKLTKKSIDCDFDIPF